MRRWARFFMVIQIFHVYTITSTFESRAWTIKN
ncbi:hypothetical protein OIU77_002201 [Salix suchowensis]|uniref:Uncharacterized protein n=1 Tax=Salix suchowensis TaxID=1278906 RepID=A0ABQ9B5C1_9ROSI|nr:hypothetical protein OIU77_002201 [Salix suchowensis]